jgi:FtsP/CotA-like multicopper oxidase with cupredoxin domain
MPATFADLIDPTKMFGPSNIWTPPPRKALKQAGGVKYAEFEIRATTVQLHPDLPPTPVWAYDGLMPGPTVVVEAGDLVHVRVRNAVPAGEKLPYAHVVMDDDSQDVNTMNQPGSEPHSKDAADAREAKSACELTGCFVMHLHGAPTPPGSDGWAESVITPGELAHHHFEFPREQFDTDAPTQGKPFNYRGGAAPMFWYHDHAMGATRFNNYAGLSGVWLVRDPIEAALGLPADEAHELPLVLQDRNFETCDATPTGPLNGKLLHKVQRGVRECFAPFTLVSGKLWPRVPVQPRVYRLRLLNGSNARYFQLRFYGMTSDTATPDDKLVGKDCVQQIGTDGGLLGGAICLPDDALILAPAERADVLIDFALAAAAGYKHVIVYNVAAAPYGMDVPEIDPWKMDPTGHPVVPQVMRFDIDPAGTPARGLNGVDIKGMALDPDFKPLPTDHTQLPPHGHSLIVLREEKEVIRDESGHPVNKDGNPVAYDLAATRTMLFLHEMMLEEDANRVGMNMHKVKNDGCVKQGIRVLLNGTRGVETYVTVAKRFTDATTIFIEKGAWHMWKVLNLSPDSHPFHVHLTQLHALTRQQLKSPAGDLDSAGFEFDLTGAATSEPAALPGWKDTFRVNPGGRDEATGVIQTAELLTIFGQFKQRAGRYMYHCHILEHEDADMMRAFVVLPEGLMRFMAHGGMAHHAATMAPKARSAGK